MSESNTALFKYLLRLGDNALILAQRNSAWCGHAPALEEDIAISNVALDLLGQARLWLSYAGEVEGQGRTEDTLAFMRNEREFYNTLLVEYPNHNYAVTLMRQYLFDAWHYLYLSALINSSNQRIADISTKALKEVEYHYDRSADLLKRLGNGTEKSQQMMQSALEQLWRFVGELSHSDEIDEEMFAQKIAPDMKNIKAQFEEKISTFLISANLEIPETISSYRSGGKTGIHTEAMGPLLAEMQHVQRSHPGTTW